MNWREEKKQAQQMLLDAGIDQSEADASVLLYEAAGWTMTQYLMHQDEQAQGEALQRYHQMIAQRCMRVPVQHITGHQDFMGLTFKTGPQALIPRQDTEVLVDLAMQYLRGRTGLKILDLCTGTGCIAISLARLCPGHTVLAADLSPQALALARTNAQQLEADVTFYEGDLFAALPEEARSVFDLIVSNPPYIASEEIADLDPEVRDHDPRLALDGGADGMQIYRRLIADAYMHLQTGGMLMLEIGAQQAGQVSALMKQAGFEQIQVHQDLAGRDRVVLGRRI